MKKIKVVCIESYFDIDQSFEKISREMERLKESRKDLVNFRFEKTYWPDETIAVLGDRMETDEEEMEREASEKTRAIQIEESERATYEKLRAKFEKKDTSDSHVRWRPISEEKK